MSLVVYADFSSARSYLASHRVDALDGVEVDWRAVERDPTVPVSGRPFGSDLQRTMSEVDELLMVDETLPWTPPARVPQTQAAVAGYAEAYGAGVGPDVRRVLFAAYWVDGADIGSPEVLRTRLAGPILRGTSPSSALRRSGFAVSGNRGPITTDAWRRIAAWREEWTALDTSDLPVIIAEDGRQLAGDEALRWLEKELAGREIHVPSADPARYPEVVGRPGQSWVSGVGGPWARAWMT